LSGVSVTSVTSPGITSRRTPKSGIEKPCTKSSAVTARIVGCLRFKWTSAGSAFPPRLHATRGFNVAEWSSEGLAFAAVSDVDARDLERFAHALQPGR
jgi:anti-sigma factor RsiW